MSSSDPLYTVMLMPGILILTCLPLLGFTIPHQGTYTGHVVDVSTSGMVWKTSDVRLRTSPESSETESFCIPKTSYGEAFRDKLQDALEDGQRVKVSYDVGYFNPPWECSYGAPIDSVVEVESSD